jgi:integrase
VPDEYTLQRLRGELAIVWYEEGRRRRHTLGTADRASAEAAARSFWAKRALGGDVHTVGEAVRVYLKGRADMASIKRAEVAWRAAESYWDKLPIARVDEQAPVDYAKRRAHCKPITIRNELAVIRAAINWCEKKGLIDKAPFIQMPKFAAKEVKALTKAQFRKLLDGAKRPHVELFMRLAVATGARSNAILDLKWDQVDLERNIIILNPRERIQTAKYRATVPINAQLREHLVKAKEGSLSDYVIEHGRERVGSIKKGFAAACERSGVKAHPHMLRHTAAVWMAEAGEPMAVIAQYLGHSDSRITERVYARFSPQFLSSAASALTY